MFTHSLNCRQKDSLRRSSTLLTNHRTRIQPQQVRDRACDSVFVDVQGLHGGAGMSRGPQDKGCSMPTSTWLHDLTSPRRPSQKPVRTGGRQGETEGSWFTGSPPSQPSSEGSSGLHFWACPYQWIQIQMWAVSNLEILPETHGTPALWEVTGPARPLRTLGDMALPHLRY